MHNSPQENSEFSLRIDGIATDNLIPLDLPRVIRKLSPVDLIWKQALLIDAPYVVPKGAPHRHNAMKVIDFALQPERMAQFAKEFDSGRPYLRPCIIGTLAAIARSNSRLSVLLTAVPGSDDASVILITISSLLELVGQKLQGSLSAKNCEGFLTITAMAQVLTAAAWP
jgi:hypothetical protein